MKTLRLFLATTMLIIPSLAMAWSNGQKGNATTNKASECSDPPYATHDWIADRALALLPDEEKAWLSPHKTLYLLGTEAPDNKKIPSQCEAPNNGYDDKMKGHSVEWEADWSDFKVKNNRKRDRAARRAQEEYEKAGCSI